MNWQKVTMVEAIEFSSSKTISKKKVSYDTERPHYAAQVLYFTDGTAIACKSDWQGPYSEVTPDIDALPPDWWIGQ